MKRIHRKNYNEPGHAHELTFSCYNRFAFLKAERTCRWLSEAINDARMEHRFNLWAYVFMPDHAHVIVWPRNATYDIARVRHAIKSPVGRKGIEHIEINAPDWLPRLIRKRGKKTERLFWQSGGGYDRNIETGCTLMKMIEYVHMNPVRKGLAQRARDWKWSSAGWYEGSRDGAPIAIDPIPSDWL